MERGVGLGDDGARGVVDHHQQQGAVDVQAFALGEQFGKAGLDAQCRAEADAVDLEDSGGSRECSSRFTTVRALFQDQENDQD
ncbi:hypothetical protein ACFXDI_40260 [Streptomyces mirabilis]|uniref:hypothetical protein n=1 Tax=Streptomyces mirabilis TaxID=68239 RepID=UPI0036ADD2CC